LALLRGGGGRSPPSFAYMDPQQFVTHYKRSLETTQDHSGRQSDVEFHQKSQKSTDCRSVLSVTPARHLQTNTYRLHADSNKQWSK